MPSGELEQLTGHLEELFASTGARKLLITQDHEAPDVSLTTAALEVPGPSRTGFVALRVGPFESMAETLGNLAILGARYVARRDGP